ncbi:hypothetical protein BH09BAC1_BH09BAC1_11580 [soil metagenome]
MKKIILWAALVITGLLIVCGVSTITTVYDEPLEQSAHYQATMKRLDGVMPRPDGDTVKVGWAKVNLEPPYPTPMAIDAERKKVYEGIQDSVYARAFVFDNGSGKAAFVTVDMLIFPPSVTAVLNDSLAGTGFSLDNVYLTATHTHSSIGAWAPGTVGEIFAGEYNAAIVAHVAHCVVLAIRNANSDLVKARIGFNKVDASELVHNRLVMDSTHIDPWFRYLRITRDDGKHAIITSFAAHPTFLHESMMKIHRDYPGSLVVNLENMPTIDFAAFAAGAMGSMGPAHLEKGPWPGIEQMAADLFYKVMQSWNNTSIDYITQLNTVHLPIDLGEQQMRLNNTFRLRPWVVKKLFGENPHFIAGLRLGNTLLVGTPCDFSGELIAEVDSFANAKGLNLMITSFDGDFVGYITHDRHYAMKAYETRTMNWFGPHNGRYFQDLIKKLSERM